MFFSRWPGEETSSCTSVEKQGLKRGGKERTRGLGRGGGGGQLGKKKGGGKHQFAAALGWGGQKNGNALKRVRVEKRRPWKDLRLVLTSNGGGTQRKRGGHRDPSGYTTIDQRQHGTGGEGSVALFRSALRGGRSQKKKNGKHVAGTAGGCSK